MVTVAAIDRTDDPPEISRSAPPSDGSFTTGVTININDVDEFDVAVTDANPAANSVPRTRSGRPWASRPASDADATNNTITYTLDDDAGGRFAIDSITGVVTVNAALDYETATSHNVTVRATSADGSFADQSFTINVTDVNETGSRRSAILTPRPMRWMKTP